MAVVMVISRSTVIIQPFDHKGLCQVQNYFAPDEDLCGQNVVQRCTIPIHCAT